MEILGRKFWGGFWAGNIRIFTILMIDLYWAGIIVSLCKFWAGIIDLYVNVMIVSLLFIC